MANSLPLFWQFYQAIADWMPRLLAGTLLVVIGGLVAAVARALLRRGLTKLFGLLHRRQPGLSGEVAGAEARLAAFAAWIVYALVWLLFAAAAADALGIPVIPALLSELGHYVPRFLLAALLLLAGVWIGAWLCKIVVHALPNAASPHAETLGQLARITVIVVAVFMAVEQLGIQTGFVAGLILLLLAALLLASGMAFAWGSRDMVRNILAAHFAQRSFHVGDRIRCGQVEGTIVRFDAGFIHIEESDGLTTLPARRLAEEAATRLRASGETS